MANDRLRCAVAPGLYRGLEPFADTDVLFGRSEDQQRLVYSLQSSRLTILYGETRVGKSSILRAGVGKDLRALSVKRKGGGEADSSVPESAVVLFDDWSGQDSDIVERLSKAVDEELTRIGAKAGSGSYGKGLVERCRAWTGRLGTENEEGELFLLLDQFDDYLLSHPRLGTAPRSFDAEFSGVLSTRGLAVNCLVAVREDFLASLDRYRRTIPNLYSSLIRLEPLNKKQAKEAIQNPVYLNYNSNHEDCKVGIEAELVSAVLNAVRLDSPLEPSGASDPSAPSAPEQRFEAGALQLVMKAVWDAESRQKSRTLRHDTFARELGGVPGITAQYVDERLSTLPPRERHLALWIFEHLVAAGGVGLTDQRELARRLDLAETDVEHLWDRLKGTRLIAIGPGRSPGSISYEMAHRVLTAAVVDRVRSYFEEKAKEEKRLAGEIERSLRLFDETSQLDGLRTIVGAGEDWSARTSDYSISGSLHVDLQNALRRILDNLEQKAQLGGYNGAVSSIAYSPDGTVLVTGAEDGSVAFWNVRSQSQAQGPLMYQGHHKTWIWALRVSADGNWLASGSDDGSVALWALNGQGLEYRGSVGGLADTPSLVRGLSFSPKDPLLAIATTDGHVRLWHLHDEKVVLDRLVTELGVRCVEFSPDGSCLATGGDDGRIRLWDLLGNEQWCTPDERGGGHASAVWGVRFHPDGKQLASCSEDHSIKLWNRESGRNERTLIGHTCWVLAIVFSPSGKLLASASEDGTARLWDEKGNRVATFIHGAPVNGLCFSPDGSTLATAAADCKVRLWKVGRDRDSKRPKLFRHPEKAILLDVGVSADGRCYATGGTDREVQVWDEEGNIGRTLKGHRHWIMSVVFHPSIPALLATGSTDGTARVWNITDGTSVEFVPLDGPVWSVAFSPDGNVLATGSNGGRICLWDVRSPSDTPMSAFQINGAVWSIRFSPDGQSIVAGCQDGSIHFQDLDGGDVRQLTGVHAGQVLSLSFSPDKRLLASSSSEGRICVWDLAKQKKQWDHNLGAPVWGIAFHPNGEIVASGSVNRSVCLWDLDGASAGRYAADGPIHGLSFSRPDGRWLVGACSDGTVRLWPIHREDFESLMIRAKGELETSVSVV